MPADNEHLRDVLRAADQVSHSSALEVNAARNGQRPPDWLRLLSGRALTASEVENGMAIPRRLMAIGEEVDLADMSSWFQEHRGATLFLRAEAGEGKSTYLSLLDNTLKDSAIVLTWLPDRVLRVDEIQDIAGTARSLFNADIASRDPESLPVVVLAELLPVLNEAVVDSVLATLNEHELRGDEAVFLIAGRPSAINSLVPLPVGAELCSLGPINATDVSALCAHLQRAYAEISSDKREDWILARFPNLPDFLKLPTGEQVSYFLAPGQPLIVGFLRAIYGNDFINRLVGEYRRMENTADGQAYLHVCLATMSGIGLPEDFLRVLAPNAALDIRSEYDPWVRTDNDEHIARHPVIAQTVLERSRAYTTLSECFEGLVELARQKPSSLQLLFDIANGVVHMRALSTADKRITARIRGRLADVLTLDSGLPSRLFAESSNAARLFSWGSLLRSVPPLTPSARYVTLYEAAVEVLKRAFDLASQADRALAERIEYALDCAVRDLALATGKTESIATREDRIMRWRDFIDRDWPGPGFYADLFDTAREVAHELTFSSAPDRDSDPLFWAYLISGIAYQYLNATHSESYINARSPYYGELFNRGMHYALPTRQVEVWKEMWRLAAALHTFPMPGLMYAQSLLEISDSQSSKDDAITTLLEVVNRFGPDPGTLHLLAKLASTRTDLIPSLKSVISDRISRPAGSMDLAILYHAAALIEEDGSLRIGYLEESVEWFSKMQWRGATWDTLGETWMEACAELKRLGASAAGCGKVFQDVRNKVQRMRR